MPTRDILYNNMHYVVRTYTCLETSRIFLNYIDILSITNRHISFLSYFDPFMPGVPFMDGPPSYE